VTHHILVVDDELDTESLISQKFRRQIRSCRYKFTFAHNGAEAYQKAIENSDIDMILTDINMPVMDGLTLLEKLNLLEHPPKTVVVSAYSDLENIRAAMNNGAFDFLTKPINFQDMEITLEKTLKAVTELKAHQEQLKQAHLQLVQKEKMAFLGNLVAGMAHEINNPITFIAGNIGHAREYVQDLLDLIDVYAENLPDANAAIEEKIEEIDLEYLREDLDKLFDSMHHGSDRIRKIILGLRNFSRLDEAELKEVDIHEGLENTLMILEHRFQAEDGRDEIAIVKQYGELPLIQCYANQLNQVFLNILSNAIDALTNSSAGQSPEIRLTTKLINRQTVRISIADNGPGISEEIRQKVFDPFFTTKPVGKGTGLGLSMSYQIITEQHQGKLQCISQPGQGTEFMIEIPV
jgi:two-component system NtrC family sensor kinase